MENFYVTKHPLRNEFANKSLNSLSEYLSNTNLPINESCNALDIKNSLKERKFIEKSSVNILNKNLEFIKYNKRQFFLFE